MEELLSDTWMEILENKEEIVKYDKILLENKNRNMWEIICNSGVYYDVLTIYILLSYLMCVMTVFIILTVDTDYNEKKMKNKIYISNDDNMGV